MSDQPGFRREQRSTIEGCGLCGIPHRQQYGDPGHNPIACINTLRPRLEEVEKALSEAIRLMRGPSSDDWYADALAVLESCERGCWTVTIAEERI